MLNQLAKKCSLFELTGPFMTYMHESNVCTILFQSLLNTTNIHIFVHRNELESPFDFLTDIKKFMNNGGFTTCEQCAGIKNDNDVKNRKDFIFENFDVSYSIHFYFRKNIISFLHRYHLNILQLGLFMYANKNINDPELIGTMEFQSGIQNKIISFVYFPSEFYEITQNFEHIMELENDWTEFKFDTFDFDFDDYDAIFRFFDFQNNRYFLSELIKWNTRVKLHPKTAVKMILLTVEPTLNLKEKDTIHQVCWVAVPSDLRYIWKIDWNKLTPSQILNIHPVINRNANKFFNDTIRVSTISEETQFEIKFLSGRLPSTCIDIVNAEMEQDLEQFIREDKNNIVFLFPLKSSDQMAAACYTRSNLEQATVFYECRKPPKSGKPLPAIVTTSYFRLDVREFPIYIFDDNYFFLLETPSQFFIVNETPKVLNLTVSRGIQEGTEDYVSGDHCQDGTSKSVSMIFPIDANSLKEAVFHVEGGNRKRTRYDS